MKRQNQFGKLALKEAPKVAIYECEHGLTLTNISAKLPQSSRRTKLDTMTSEQRGNLGDEMQ